MDPPPFYACPCCEQLTLEEKPPATFEICSQCRWEDDNVQFHDPNVRGGANTESLNDARAAIGVPPLTPIRRLRRRDSR